MKGATKKLNSIQILRGIACLMVFYSHISFFLPECFGLGHAAVSIFIILSGFLIGFNGNLPRNGIEYAYNKMKKLWPLHCVMFIVSIPLLFLETALIVNLKTIVKLFVKGVINLCLLQSWIGKSSIYFGYNGVAWFLSTMMFLYLAAPYLYRFFKTKKCLISLCIMYLIMIVLGCLIGKYNYEYTTYIFPIIRLFDFTCGIISGIWFRNKSERNLNQLVIAICTFVMALILEKYLPQFMRLSIWYVPFSIFLIYSVAGANDIIQMRGGGVRLVSCIGNMSMEIFLLHQVIIRYGILLQKNFLINKCIVLIGIVCLTIILSQILYSYRINKKKVILMNSNKGE